MAQPTVNVTPDKTTPYAPGEQITLDWIIIDADNSTEAIVLEGVDSQGNTWTGRLAANRQDTFTMTSVRWERTGAPFLIDNATRTATGRVPDA